MSMKKCILLNYGLAVLFLLWPDISAACPKCFASTAKQVLNAYYVSIAFMVLIPFGIIGSILAWIHRQHRRARCHAPDENVH
jgi:hypothetical protein